MGALRVTATLVACWLALADPARADTDVDDDPAPRVDPAENAGALERSLVISDLEPYDFLILPEDDRPYTEEELVRTRVCRHALDA